jgi:Tfp pilus assembly protein PilF
LLAAELPILLSTSSTSSSASVAGSSSILDSLCVLRDECLREAQVLEDVRVCQRDRVEAVKREGRVSSSEVHLNDDIQVIFHLPPHVPAALCRLPPPTDACVVCGPQQTEGAADVLHVCGFSNVDAAIETWYSRADKCTFALATHVVATKDFVLALQLLDSVLERRPEDVSLLSGAGRVLLQMGHISAAADVFSRVESCLTKLGREPDSEPLVRSNRGLLLLSRSQYQSALAELRSALALFGDSDDHKWSRRSRAVIASNHAVCRLFMCQLPDAIKELEGLVFGDPANNLQTPIVANLCMLYELRSDSTRSNERKKRIMAVAGKHAPDSFDFKVLKITPQSGSGL